MPIALSVGTPNNVGMDTHPDSQIIDRLGGTAAVARMCNVKQPSVSEWRTRGIPAARRQYLELLHPQAFSADAANESAGDADAEEFKTAA
jgi:hypothetical protein